MSEEKKGFFKSFVEKITGNPSPPPADDVADSQEKQAKPGFFERLTGTAPPPPADGVADSEEKQVKPGFFERLKKGLSKTHESLVGRIDTLLLGKKQVDAETLEELEEILVTADIGLATTVELVKSLEQRLKRNELQDGEALKNALKEEMLARLEATSSILNTDSFSPFVIIVIGVNGVGKTTTIGKLASKFTSEGKKVLLVAADTFRAAAVEQLEIWGQRVGDRCDSP